MREHELGGQLFWVNGEPITGVVMASYHVGETGFWVNGEPVMTVTTYLFEGDFF